MKANFVKCITFCIMLKTCNHTAIPYLLNRVKLLEKHILIYLNPVPIDAVTFAN